MVIDLCSWLGVGVETFSDEVVVIASEEVSVGSKDMIVDSAIAAEEVKESGDVEVE